MNELLILDVGHGNAALLVSNESSAIFDAAPGTTLSDAIEQRGLSVIHHLFLSHADNDHVGGVIALLSMQQIEVRNLYLNPDSSKYGPRWTSLCVAIQDAMRRGTLKLGQMYEGESITVGQTTVVGIAPSPSAFLSGPRGQDNEGVELTSNSASAVLALDHLDHRVVLFAGDMDQSTFDRIPTPQVLNANILVFPHHGGLSGPNTAQFAEDLARMVEPHLTLFSIGRGHYQNPRPEVVEAVRRGCATTHILCTQLSLHCSSILPNVSDNSPIFPSKGIAKGECCGGSVLVRLHGANSRYEPLERHQRFVQSYVSNALCQLTILNR